MDGMQSSSKSFNKNQWIKDVTPNEEIASLFLIAASSQQQAKNGPFWRLELKDVTGTIEARIWSPMSLEYPKIPTGIIAYVKGRSESYREQLQINIIELHIIDENELLTIDIGMFLPASVRSSQDMFSELEAICNKEFTHKPWHRFVFSILNDPEVKPKLLVAPAAKGVHHAWVGGLLEHILSVVKVSLLICNHYSCLDRQTLLAGAIFHDIGKLWELSGGLDNDYTDEGRLIGHINISLEKFQSYLIESGLEEGLAMHFKHLVLSHHGLYEFASPRLPQTAEAFALHYIDNLDAKIAQSITALQDISSGETGWSSYQKTLERQLYQAIKTPLESNKLEDQSIKQKVSQCSLL